jgi:hypothetical protein
VGAVREAGSLSAWEQWAAFMTFSIWPKDTSAAARLVQAIRDEWRRLGYQEGKPETPMPIRGSNVPVNKPDLDAGDERVRQSYSRRGGYQPRWAGGN